MPTKMLVFTGVLILICVAGTLSQNGQANPITYASCAPLVLWIVYMVGSAIVNESKANKNNRLPSLAIVVFYGFNVPSWAWVTLAIVLVGFVVIWLCVKNAGPDMWNNENPRKNAGPYL